MIEASPLIPHAKESMMINIIITGIDPAELSDDVLSVPGINIVRANQTKCLTEPSNGLLILRRSKNGVTDPLHAGRAGSEPDDLSGAVQRRDARINRLTHHMDRLNGVDAVDNLDRIPVGFYQTDSLATARFVDALDIRCARVFRDGFEVVLVAHHPCEANELGIAPFGDMNVVCWIGAAHVKRRGRPGRSHHA